MSKKNLKQFIIILLASLVLFTLNPLSFNLNQNIIFSFLFMTVCFWATNCINKNIACIILLAVFIIFGETPALEVINFAWSPTLLLIVTSTLLSVGIMKTQVIDKYIVKLFKKSSNNIFKLLTIPYFFGIILVFLIPQAFARVIIVGTIYNSLIKASDRKEEKAKQALIFNSFIAITMTYMMFSNGDIVLNYAAINFSGDQVSSILDFSQWFKLMALPSLIASFFVLILTSLIFKKDLSYFNSSMIKDSSEMTNKLNQRKQFISIITILIVIAFWMTESIHKISPWISALIGVLILFIIGVLKKEDLKSVNPGFLLFLTTAFSIGKVLGQSGITDIIFSKLELLLPQAGTNIYLISLAAITMILHICIGSSVATMSVILPIFIPMAINQNYNPLVITLLVYIMVNIHFLLPFHHATMMIGSGKNYYTDKHLLKFGIFMTFFSFLILIAIYFPWWKLLGYL